MKQLRVAIIGQGRSGWGIHGEYLAAQNHRYNVVAIVDMIEKRRMLAKERYGNDVLVFDDYRKLFGLDLDFVVNSSYSNMHYPITMDLLEHGYNVLCEKPFARTSDEVQNMIDQAVKFKREVMVFQNSRYSSYFRKIKEVIDSGCLGDLIQISMDFSRYERRWDWQTLQSYNGGNLYNSGPHPMDQAVVLYGEGYPNIKAFMNRANTYGDAEDYVKVVMWGENKPVIDLEVTSCQGYKPYTYNIQGSRGALNGSMTHIEWKYFIPEECEKQELKISFDKPGTDTPAYCSENIKWHEFSWDETDPGNLFNIMTAGYYEMMYGHLTESKKMMVTLEEVKKQISIIEECHRQNPLSRIDF
jgi:predicted dehydrogenase